MKLKSLIAKLEKARASYVKKHGVEPTIWNWTDELELCAGTKRMRGEAMRGATLRVRPYQDFKIVNTWG